ncbi:HAMP domain-containing histidine kinase [Candidatus Dojkabacteria bacterium]|nr:HAMP domain-containing histidine kinase [Candidatus Dojkabacteria bacterium]
MRIFVGKFVYFTFVSVVPYIAFFAIYLFQTETWGSIWDLKAIFSGYFIAAIFVYLLFLADNKVSHFVQKNIVYHSFDPEKLNKQLIDTVSKQLELEDVLNQVYEVIEKVFLPNSLDIYVFDNQNKVLSYRDEHLYIEEKVEPVFANIVKIIDDADDNEILMYNELLLQYIDEGIRGYSKEDIAAIVKFMKERKFEILLPYQQSKNQLRVLVFIGSKQTNSAYTIGELRFIKEIISSSNVAIERALYHQQVQDHAVRLKSEIDKATQELQLKNQQLEETLRKERDMMDILGHELRTPLTIGKNAMRYLKQDYEKDGTVTPEVMKKYLAMADENLTREARLLETLLSTTKIDNKAVNLHIEKADLVDAVNDSLDALRLKAEERGLQVIYNPPAESFIYADRNRTQEIVDNLIDNAIKYTKQGSITIEIIPGEKETAFRVTDTGVGIPEKDLEKLGQKFYRINTYLDSSIESDYKVVRPGGTGLGLYVTFSLVELMGGKVQVESEVGKGSIFTVTLPTYTGQAEKDNGYSNGKTVFERFEEMKKAKLDSSENLN